VVLHTLSGVSSFGFYRDGVITNSDSAVAPIVFPSQDNIDVTVSYNGSILSVSFADGAQSFGPQNYLVGSLASSLGGSTAYIGFTAGNGDITAYHILNAFAYTVPTPAGASLFGLAGIGLGRRKRPV